MDSTQVILASRPKGEPSAENFDIVTRALDPVETGQVMLKTRYLSLDPYMRARMYDGVNYAGSVALGAVMVGETVAEVVESHHPDLCVGDVVTSRHGWQSHAVVNGTDLQKIDPTIAPVSTALHVLGMTGLTAYGGLLKIGRPQGGETLLVSAASGSVGSIVAQIGKLKGLRVVGLAGGAEKCAYLTETLGLDAAVNHRAPDVAEELEKAAPDGIDIYYDNVAGPLAAMVLPLMNRKGRYLVCGTIAHNRDLGPSTGPDHLQTLLATVLVKQLRVEGFLFDDFRSDITDFRRDMSDWLASGTLQYREDIVRGLENAPSAFLGLFQGQNSGKLLIEV